VNDQAVHQYKTTGKIIILYILIFVYLDSKLKDKGFWSIVYNYNYITILVNISKHHTAIFKQDIPVMLYIYSII